MYFCYGWPKVLAVDSRKEDVVYLHLGQDFLVLVSTEAIQVWSGGQQRVRLGTLRRDQKSVDEDGLNRRAVWCPSRRLLAVLTYKSVLQIYGLHISKDSAILQSGPVQGLDNFRRVDLYLQSSIALSNAGMAMANDLVCDSRCILLGFSDGSFQCYSWHCKKKGEDAMPFAMYMEIQSRLDLPRGSRMPVSATLRPTMSDFDWMRASGHPFHMNDAAPHRTTSLSSGSPSAAATASNAVFGPHFPADLSRGALDAKPPTDALKRANFRDDGGAATKGKADKGGVKDAKQGESGSGHDRQPARPINLPLPPVPVLGWKAESPLSDRLRTTSNSSAYEVNMCCVEFMDYCAQQSVLAVVLADGRCAVCRTASGSLHPVSAMEVQEYVCGVGSGTTCARFGPGAQMLALGLVSGEVALYRIGKSAPVRMISLAEWGYEPETTGSVSDIAWSPDDRALAVGWRRSGLGLWSVSGCRLLCSLRQTPRTPRSAQAVMGLPRPRTPNSLQAPSLECGVSALTWALEGYKLMVAEAGGNCQVLELTLAKSLPNAHRVPMQDLSLNEGVSWLPPEVYILQAEDRVLLVTDRGEPARDGFRRMNGEGFIGGNNGGLTLHHLKPPPAYVAANWPLVHVAVSPDASDIAVAGLRGICLYSRRSGRWRMFGDISQERDISVKALSWLPRIVVLCATVDGRSPPSTSATQLLLYPRHYLDTTSLLGRFPLSEVPIAMDALEEWVLLLMSPMTLLLLNVKIIPPLTKDKQARAIIQPCTTLELLGHMAPPRVLSWFHFSTFPCMCSSVCCSFCSCMSEAHGGREGLV
eukprot:jgi/Botrbrau1/349/Bobra.110_2s0008.1